VLNNPVQANGMIVWTTTKVLHGIIFTSSATTSYKLLYYIIELSTTTTTTLLLLWMESSSTYYNNYIHLLHHAVDYDNNKFISFHHELSTIINRLIHYFIYDIWDVLLLKSNLKFTLSYSSSDLQIDSTYDDNNASSYYYASSSSYYSHAYKTIFGAATSVGGTNITTHHFAHHSKKAQTFISHRFIQSRDHRVGIGV
jgi:hypothetical protein